MNALKSVARTQRVKLWTFVTPAQKSAAHPSTLDMLERVFPTHVHGHWLDLFITRYDLIKTVYPSDGLIIILTSAITVIL